MCGLLLRNAFHSLGTLFVLSRFLVSAPCFYLPAQFFASPCRYSLLSRHSKNYPAQFISSCACVFSPIFVKQSPASFVRIFSVQKFGRAFSLYFDQSLFPSNDFLVIQRPFFNQPNFPKYPDCVSKTCRVYTHTVLGRLSLSFHSSKKFGLLEQSNCDDFSQLRQRTS